LPVHRRAFRPGVVFRFCDWFEFLASTFDDDIITSEFLAGTRLLLLEAFPWLLSRWISGIIQATNVELTRSETVPVRLSRQLRVLLRITAQHAGCLPIALLINNLELMLRVVSSCWIAAMRPAPAPKPRNVSLPDSFEEFLAVQQRLAEDRVVDEQPLTYSLQQDCFAMYCVVAANMVHAALRHLDVDVGALQAIVSPVLLRIGNAWSQLLSLNVSSGKSWSMSPVPQVITCTSTVCYLP
jgi:hypothetical protein